MKHRVIGIVSVAAALLLAAAVGLIAFDLLVESYGDGPPYYGRTVNMDKWSNPLPRLAAISAIGLSLSGLLAWFGVRQLRR